MPPKQIDSAPALQPTETVNRPSPVSPNQRGFPVWPLPADRKLEGPTGEALERLRALVGRLPSWAAETYNQVVEIHNSWELSPEAKDQRMGKLAVARVKEMVALFGEPLAKLKTARAGYEATARKRIAEAGARDDRGVEIRSWLRGLSSQDRNEALFMARNGKLAGGEELLLAVLGAPLSARMAGFSPSECELVIAPARSEWCTNFAGGEIARLSEIDAATECAQTALRWLENQAKAMVPNLWLDAATAEWRKLSLEEKVARTAQLSADGRYSQALAESTGTLVY